MNTTNGTSHISTALPNVMPMRMPITHGGQWSRSGTACGEVLGLLLLLLWLLALVGAGMAGSVLVFVTVSATAHIIVVASSATMMATTAATATECFISSDDGILFSLCAQKK